MLRVRTLGAGNVEFTNEHPGAWAHVDYTIQREADYGITILAGPMFAGSYRGCAESGAYCPDIEGASDAVMTDHGVFLGSWLRPGVLIYDCEAQPDQSHRGIGR